MKVIRTNSANSDFVILVSALDKYLAVTDGDEHSFYDQYNKLDNIKHVIVVYGDDQPIACGAIKAFDEHTYEIKRMYTDPISRGKGIAGVVLTELESWAYELGGTRCLLETGLRQTAAVRLYKKSNYQVINNYGQYAGMENSICFEKNLEQ